jgi:predicted exporter
LVDLQAASQSLLATYRDRLLKILGVALLVVALILGLALRGGQRWGWVLGTVVAALALTVALVSRLAGSLSLFDLVAATLVAGLGHDYALFFSRPPRDGAEHRNTLHALTVCFASTLTVFGLLATSSIPVLHGIGITVAAGVVVAYTLAFAGRSTSPGS